MWFRDLFSEIMVAVIPILTQRLINELLGFAYDVVTKLNSTDLTNEQKRQEAFKQLVDEAKKRGLTYRDSSINFLIETAIQKLKGQIDG